MSDEPSDLRVGVVMGSSSDLDVMRKAGTVLDELGIAHEVRVVSAHRSPEAMLAYGKTAASRGLQVLIAGAGGAAHLPGMLAATCDLPVIGVPVSLRNLDGLDSLLSIVQMPRGVPVATVAVDGAENAALLAAQVLATSDPSLRPVLAQRRAERAEQAAAQDREIADLLREGSSD